MACALEPIIAEVDRLLEPQRFEDYAPNGLQVPGGSQIQSIATGVSASVELFERARDQGAQLIVVHHGLFWGSGPSPINQSLKRRLKVLFDADIALAAYHLPLDAHPKLGNNALLAERLGATELEPFAMHRGEHIGMLARFAQDGLDAEELFARVRALTSREPLLFEHGPSKVKRIGIVSGAGTDFLAEAIHAGADAFLTGEPAERAMAQAREGSLHYIAAGHYATETLGVKCLGEHLAQTFALDHAFIDVPNPV